MRIDKENCGSKILRRNQTRLSLSRLSAYLRRLQSSLTLMMKLSNQHEAIRLSIACLSAYIVLVSLARKERLSFRRRQDSTDATDRKSRLASARERRFQLRVKLGIGNKR